MRILEARFHPSVARGRDYIVVGHVIVEVDGKALVTRVKPACSLVRHRAPATMLATLRYLARVSAPDPWVRLPLLNNPHWSFVVVEPIAAGANGDAEIRDDRDRGGDWA
jgi:hypothetical protein